MKLKTMFAFAVLAIKLAPSTDAAPVPAVSEHPNTRDTPGLSLDDLHHSSSAVHVYARTVLDKIPGMKLLNCFSCVNGAADVKKVVQSEDVPLFSTALPSVSGHSAQDEMVRGASRRKGMQTDSPNSHTLSALLQETHVEALPDSRSPAVRLQASPSTSSSQSHVSFPEWPLGGNAHAGSAHGSASPAESIDDGHLDEDSPISSSGSSNTVGVPHPYRSHYHGESSRASALTHDDWHSMVAHWIQTRRRPRIRGVRTDFNKPDKGVRRWLNEHVKAYKEMRARMRGYASTPSLALPSPDTLLSLSFSSHSQRSSPKSE